MSSLFCPAGTPFFHQSPLFCVPYVLKVYSTNSISSNPFALGFFWPAFFNITKTYVIDGPNRQNKIHYPGDVIAFPAFFSIPTLPEPYTG
jgi:hypothetical protein